MLVESHAREPERFRRAPLPYPREFNDQIDAFVEAIGIAVNGRPSVARGVVQALDHKPIVEWFDGFAQHAGSERLKFLGKKAVKRSGGGKRDMRQSRVRRLAERDGYRCGYCDIRIIEPRILRKVDKLLGGRVIRGLTEKRSNLSYHGIWLLTAVTLDHIEPLAENYNDTDQNLVACCWACNFGKYHYTLDELQLQHPIQQREIVGSWDGLLGLVR